MNKLEENNKSENIKPLPDRFGSTVSNIKKYISVSGFDNLTKDQRAKFCCTLEFESFINYFEKINKLIVPESQVVQGSKEVHKKVAFVTATENSITFSSPNSPVEFLKNEFSHFQEGLNEETYDSKVMRFFTALYFSNYFPDANAYTSRAMLITLINPFELHYLDDERQRASIQKLFYQIISLRLLKISKGYGLELPNAINSLPFFQVIDTVRNNINYYFSPMVLKYIAAKKTHQELGTPIYRKEISVDSFTKKEYTMYLSNLEKLNNSLIKDILEIVEDKHDYVFSQLFHER